MPKNKQKPEPAMSIRSPLPTVISTQFQLNQTQLQEEMSDVMVYQEGGGKKKKSSLQIDFLAITTIENGLL